jgi:D-sedoheptulose 7-phosphate isomerase
VDRASGAAGFYNEGEHAAMLSRQNDNRFLESAVTVASDYVRELEALLRDLDYEAIGRVAARLEAARNAGSAVYLAGNGGSAATASHWVNDLVKATKCSDKPPFRAVCLSDNTSLLTALANDEGYDRVFSGLLESLAVPGDVLVVISASGNSPNLVDAVQLAARLRLGTIGVLGFDGGKLRTMVDDCVLVATEPGAYGLVESAHSVVCDIVTTCLIRTTTEASASVGVQPVSG